MKNADQASKLILVTVHDFTVPIAKKFGPNDLAFWLIFTHHLSGGLNWANRSAVYNLFNDNYSRINSAI